MITHPVGSRVVRCPGCGGACVYSTENPNRPFCSARCKNNDFGAWASERFSVDADALADAGVDSALPGDGGDASAPAKPAQRDNQ